MSTRKTISRLVSLGGLCTAVALVATGCGAGGPAATSTSAEGSVNVLVEAGGRAELTGVAEQCKKDTGLDVNFVELPYDGLFNRLSSEFSSGSVSFDVAALDSVWLPSFKDALQPIDELFTDEAKQDIFPALVKEANVDGHFIGMPAWTNAEIILYRKDLFEDATNKADFQAKYGYELAAPTTWKQYQDISEFFTKDGMYGTDVKGAVETEWLAHVLQAGSPIVLDENNNVVIDNAAHKEALDFYVSLTKSAPAGAAQVDWAAAQNLFNQGQTAPNDRAKILLRAISKIINQLPNRISIYGHTSASAGVIPAKGCTAPKVCPPPAMVTRRRGCSGAPHPPRPRTL